MKKFLLLVCSMFFIYAYGENGEGHIPLPSPQQLRWQQYEQIMFLCMDPCTWQGREYDNHSYPISQINPKKLNTDQWCEVAKSWGAKLILFVAKHTGGFCWWQTNTTDYSIKNIPWQEGKGDVLKELSNSCKKYGIDLGVYVYSGDSQWGAGIGSGGKTSDPSKQEAYNKIYRQQMTEVLTNYGLIREVWFDGGCIIPVDDILEKYASDAVIFGGKNETICWVGNEDGIAPSSNWYVKDGKYVPAECDVPLLNNGGHKWFWAPGTDSLICSVDQLMDIYYKSVGRGSVLLLNASPDTTGLIPDSHVKRYAEFGREIHRRFSNPVATLSGTGREHVISFPKSTLVNHCIIQELLEKGQRITSFMVEGYTPESKWELLYHGTSVGHKKIAYWDDIELLKIRLRVLSSLSVPMIDKFSVYHVDGMPLSMNKKNKKEFSLFSFDDSTLETGEWKELVFDLTPYVNEIGYYNISFKTLNSDSVKEGIEFKDWKLEMYGRNFPDGIIEGGTDNLIRICRSQQTLDEFPTKLRVKVRRFSDKIIGNIVLDRMLND